MFDLMFDGKKISTYQQLRDNFDFDSVRLYCLGGSLSSWLDSCGESEIAERVRGVDIHGDIDLQLAEIFGQPAPVRVNIQKAQAVNNAKNALSSFVMGADSLAYAIAANNSTSFNRAVGQLSSFELGTGSFIVNSGSFLSGSYTNILGSFEQNIGSFVNTTSSFKIGSFRIGSGFYEYESEYETGSFRNISNSFKIEQSSCRNILNSFSMETTSFSYKTSSYNINSFTAFSGLSSFSYSFSSTSFSSSSFSLSSFSPSSFVGTSFSAGTTHQSGDRADLGSCREGGAEEKPVLEEIPKTAEEKICDNLTYSPLNRYGYGIHLI